MININFIKDKSIEVNGHANFDNKGNDIVCAGVSAIVIGAINWFDQNEIIIVVDESKAYIKIQITKLSQPNKDKLSLILVQLEAIEASYAKWIKITK